MADEKKDALLRCFSIMALTAVAAFASVVYSKKFGNDDSVYPVLFILIYCWMTSFGFGVIRLGLQAYKSRFYDIYSKILIIKIHVLGVAVILLMLLFTFSVFVYPDSGEYLVFDDKVISLDESDDYLFEIKNKVISSLLFIGKESVRVYKRESLTDVKFIKKDNSLGVFSYKYGDEKRCQYLWHCSVKFTLASLFNF